MPENQEFPGGWNSILDEDGEVKDTFEDFEIEEEPKEETSEEEDLDEDTSQDQEEDDASEEEDTDEDYEEEETEEDEEDTPSKASKPDERELLLQQLLREKAELDRKNKELEGLASKTALDRLQERSETLKQQKEHSESQMKYLNETLVKYQQDGDYEKAAEIQQKIINAHVDQRIINQQMQNTDAEIARRKDTPVSNEVPPQNTAPQQNQPLPPALTSWLEKNKSWFQDKSSKENQRKTRLAFLLNQELMQEGYLQQTEAFYNELDKRLADTLGTTVVVKKRRRVNMDKAKVAGGSLSSKTGKRQKVLPPLTPTQKIAAEQLGFTEKEYQKLLKNHDSTGMVR
jgi:hypothetical protein